MKLYNKNLVVHNIDIDKIKEYLIKTRNISYIFSNEGMFRIYDNKDLHKIDIQDGSLEILNNYVNGQNYVIDHTIIKKIPSKNVSHIPIHHVKNDYKVTYYSLRTKSPIMLVIEQHTDNSIYDVYFMLRETYAAYSNADIYNPFIIEDIGNFCNLIKQ
jgi:hypothetical protein